MSQHNAARQRVRLGVNVDHVATIRQARGTRYPDPLFAASLAELAGADQITIHLREDRRHIQERDLRLMRDTVQVPLNLEMANTEEMLAFALEVRPDTVTLVPEKRQERTTEGGLDVVGQLAALSQTVTRLKEAGMVVSMFIDPELDQVRASSAVGAAVVELHTGDFCDAPTSAIAEGHFARLHGAAVAAYEAGLVVAAGHGIDYQNVRRVVTMPHVEELNIGHSIIARAIFVGLERAVAEMARLMNPASGAP